MNEQTKPDLPLELAQLTSEVAGDGWLGIREDDEAEVFEVTWTPPAPEAVTLGSFPTRPMAERFKGLLEAELAGRAANAGAATWDPGTGYGSLTLDQLNLGSLARKGTICLQNLPGAVSQELTCAMSDRFIRFDSMESLRLALVTEIHITGFFQVSTWRQPVGAWLTDLRRQGFLNVWKNPAIHGFCIEFPRPGRPISADDLPDVLDARYGVVPAPSESSYGRWPDEPQETAAEASSTTTEPTGPLEAPEVQPEAAEPTMSAPSVAAPQEEAAAAPPPPGESWQACLIWGRGGRQITFDSPAELIGILAAEGKRIYMIAKGGRPSQREARGRNVLKGLEADGKIVVAHDGEGWYMDLTDSEAVAQRPPSPAADEPREPDAQAPKLAPAPVPGSSSADADLDPRRASGLRKWMRDLIHPFVGMEIEDVRAKSGATIDELLTLQARGDIAIIHIGKRSRMVFPDTPTHPPMGDLSSNERRLYGELRKARDVDGATRLTYEDMALLLPRQMRVKVADMLKALEKAKLVNVLERHSAAALPLTMRVVI